MADESKKTGEAFLVAGWRVDPSSLEISYGCDSVKLEPKVMAVLDYLACRPGVVVSRQELEDEIWRGTIVGYDALSNAIIKIRKAFGDKARAPHIIETIAKTGYRLIADIDPQQSSHSSASQFDSKPQSDSVSGPNPESDADIPTCPYPGMVPFAASDAQYFYGREDEIRHMVQMLRQQSFLVLLGPSGSGKSSLVYAGLLPALEQSPYFGDGFWLIGKMRPGAEPIERLTELLGGKHPNEFARSPVDELLATNPEAKKLLVLVDQFEEVFTLCDTPDQLAFVNALGLLRSDPNCTLVLTLRADFYPDLMTSALWPVDAAERVEIVPLRGDELRLAIQSPAADVGVQIEDSLVTQLLNDAADEPGSLPLLQETMSLMWAEIEQNKLAFTAYQQLSTGDNRNPFGSGLAAAIAMKADATLAALNSCRQQIARRIFLRLIQFGEGRANTRRQQTVESLGAQNGDADFEATLEHLTNHRLLTRSGGQGKLPPAVDISHESLIDGWGRLQHWVEERRDGEQTRRRLQARAAEWVRLGKDKGGLLDDVSLQEAERWLAGDDAVDLGIDQTLTELVEHSRQAIEAAEHALESARQRELDRAAALAEEQHKRIDEQTVAGRQMRRAIAALAVALVAAVSAGLFAWHQNDIAQTLAVQENQARQSAEAQRAAAEQARLESIAQLLLIQAPLQFESYKDEVGVLLARQAYLFAQNGGRSLQTQVDKVLRKAVDKSYFSPVITRENGYSLALNSDGSKLASTGEKIKIWDVNDVTAEPLVLPGGYPGGDFWLYGLAFSPDDKYLTVANADGTTVRWNLDNPYVPYNELAQLKGGVWKLAYSPDGRWLVAGSKKDDSFALWDLSKPESGPVIVTHPDAAAPGSGPDLSVDGGVPVAFNSDGSRLATGSLNGVVHLWNPESLLAPVASIHHHVGTLAALAFSHDDKSLVTSDMDAAITITQLDNLTAPARIVDGGAAASTSLDFSKDGKSLALASAEGIRLLDTQALDKPPQLLPIGYFFNARFSPDNRYLAIRGSSSYLRLLDLSENGQPTVLHGHQGSGVLSLAFSDDQKWLASGGGTGDGSIRLWQWEKLDADPPVLQGHKGSVNSLQFSADGKSLLSASWNDNSILLWSLDELPPTFTSLPVPEQVAPWTAQFSTDETAVNATGTGGMYRWQLADLDAAPKVIIPNTSWSSGLTTTTRKTHTAISSNGKSILLKDLSKPNETARELVRPGQPNDSFSVQFSPNGQWLASGGKTDPALLLWNVANPKQTPIEIGRHDESITRVRFSPDGKQIASASVDKSLRLWKPQNPKALPIVLSAHEGELWALTYSPDGRYVVTGSRDKTVRVWDLSHPINHLNTAELADSVCEKVRRNLSLEEWQQLAGEDVPYERTCTNLPIHPSLFDAAAKLAKRNDIEAATALLERALRVDPTLDIDPAKQVRIYVE